jgi:hypothetical protein
MKTSIPRFPQILSVSAAILVSLNCAPAKILIEDDFTKPPSGVSANANIANRQPTNRPAWAGTAKEQMIGWIMDMGWVLPIRRRAI